MLRITCVVKDVRPAGNLAVGDEVVAVATVVLEPVNDPPPGTDRDKLWHPGVRVSGELRLSAVLEDVASTLIVGTLHDLILENA